ncbi:MAG: hypothetical protein AAF146_14210 [Bacteroidota bacterium]
MKILECGSSLKKEEFVGDCADIDDIIVFRKDGKFQVVRMADKVFVGKNIIHIAVWKKGDERTTYNLIYLDGATGRTMAKRFNVTAITREREYNLTKGTKGSKLFYFTANPNGEAEKVTLQLSQGCKAKKKQLDFDFSELDIKGRAAGGNLITKYPVRKVSLLELGKSTLGAQKVWIDEVSGRLNTEERGRLLGEFDTGDDDLIVLYHDGSYELLQLELTKRFEPKEILYVGKLHPKLVVSAVYYDGNKGWTMVKRFAIETTKKGHRQRYLTEHRSTKLLFASVKPNPRISYKVRVNSQTMPGEVTLSEFIDVKGWRALGNKLSDRKLTAVKEVQAPLKPGDTIELGF